VPAPALPLWLLAALVAGLAAALAWRGRSLTAGGAVAATAVGTAIGAALGPAGLAILAAFFVPSSLLSRLLPAPPPGDAKGDRRDAAQVLANGGAAAAAALLEFARPGLGLWAAAAALAAASADTWATTIGVWSGRAPKSILDRSAVAPGTSGGVTLPGTAAGVLGALAVGVPVAMAGGGVRAAAAATLLGAAWMLGDSILGAAVQARFHCPACGLATERPIHRCGVPAAHTGGWRWLTNDGVNLLATLGAALDGALAWWLCS
jgi:uncharacterized protein (TIGR00297 family)